MKPQALIISGNTPFTPEKIVQFLDRDIGIGEIDQFTIYDFDTDEIFDTQDFTIEELEEEEIENETSYTIKTKGCVRGPFPDAEEEKQRQQEFEVLLDEYKNRKMQNAAVIFNGQVAILDDYLLAISNWSLFSNKDLILGEGADFSDFAEYIAQSNMLGNWGILIERSEEPSEVRIHSSEDMWQFTDENNVTFLSTKPIWLTEQASKDTDIIRCGAIKNYQIGESPEMIYGEDVTKGYKEEMKKLRENENLYDTSRCATCKNNNLSFTVKLKLKDDNYEKYRCLACAINEKLFYDFNDEDDSSINNDSRSTAKAGDW